MNKSALVKTIAAKAKQSDTGGGGPRNHADAEKIINAFIEIVSKELEAKGKVTLAGFGTFAVAHRKTKYGVNPKTGEKITIQAKDVPVFKAGRNLKDIVE
ncbi:MAG: HU family DNA-binding protein [bacterium]|nr:HU family DNA-binding protein [Desulfobacteraceae bacterium]MCP4221559.1 HU family DNA-binding protein [bacterium]